MKNLCTTKKYDLSQLNDEQLTSFLYELAQKYNTPVRNYSRAFLNEIIEVGNLLCFYEYNGEWGSCSKSYNEYVNALELFEEEPNCCEITVNTMGRVEPKYPNYSCDKSDIYESAHNLIEKGKQHGLKIVVTFEIL